MITRNVLSTNGSSQRLDWATDSTIAALPPTTKFSWSAMCMIRTIITATRGVAFFLPVASGLYALSIDFNATIQGDVSVTRWSSSGNGQNRTTTTNALTPGLHHVAVTAAGANDLSSDLHIYVDGVEITGTNASTNGTNIYTSNGRVSIGGRPAGDRWLNVNQWNVGFWNGRQLTLAEIQELATGVAPASLSTGTASLAFAPTFSTNTTDPISGVTPTSVGSAGVVSVTMPSTVIPGFGGWWKADELIYSDAGTTPIADGGSVYQISDRSGMNNNLLQTTSAQRPVFTAAGTAHPAMFCTGADGVSSSGVGRSMTTTLGLGLDLNNNTVVMVGASRLPAGTGIGGQSYYNQAMFCTGDFSLRVQGMLDYGSPRIKQTGKFGYGDLISTGSTALTAWATGTSYSVADIRSSQGQAYYCAHAHTSASGTNAPEVDAYSGWTAEWAAYGFWSSLKAPSSFSVFTAAASGSSVVMRINGTESTVTRGTRASKTNTSVRVGAADVSGTPRESILGNWSDVLIFYRQLTSGERATLETELATLRGVNLTPTAVVVGEASSSMAGYDCSAQKEYLIRSAFTANALCYNAARAGDEIAAPGVGSAGDAGIEYNYQNTTQKDYVDSCWVSGKRGVLALWVGANDLVSSKSSDDATVVNDLYTNQLLPYIADRRAAMVAAGATNVKVICFHLLPRVDGNGTTTCLLAQYIIRINMWNALLNAAEGHGVIDKVIRLRDNALIGGDSINNGTYAGSIHLTEAGVAVASSMFDLKLAQTLGLAADGGLTTNPAIRLVLAME